MRLPDGNLVRIPDGVVPHFITHNHDLFQPQNLRTKSALAKTVSYLLTSVMRSQEFSFFDKYNFIFDRLRSVRQELTIQVTHKEIPRIYSFFFVLAFISFLVRSQDTDRLL